MPLIFLSHSGRNGLFARQLRDRILATPAARNADLRVWLDLVDLDAGRPWKSQIETVIENEATAFAVIVDPCGVQTWVSSETDAALSRAVKDDSFRFIPILPDGGRSADLSPFVRRYQAIRADPLTDDFALQSLIKAALGGTEDAGRPKITDDPFPGLLSMDERWSDRFFGRATETGEVIAQLRANPIVVIAADSGAGKSSLAMAGVGTAWRGGALDADETTRPPPRNWNTIAFRPLDNPLVSLTNAIRNDFARRGVQSEAQADILEVVRCGDPEAFLFLLSRGMPDGDTRTLIIVDQAEELFTQTSDAKRRSQILKLLAALAETGQQGARCRILFVLRADFQNQLQQCEETADRLGTLTDGTNRYRLKRLSDEGVRDMVLRPLAMAGFDDDAEAHELADRITTDLTNDEGDLALAQFALSETWRNRGKRGGLLEAYRSVDGVAGALARTAESLIKTDEFVSAHEARIVPLFFRLIRLDAQAFRISRRLAPLSEFSETDRKLIALFASAEGGRLLHTTDEFVEISHEKLITQWARLHDAIGQNDTALRCLNRNTEAALTWHENKRSGKFLTSVADEEAFRALASSNGDWVSEAEQSFLSWSRKRHRTNQLFRATGIAAVLASLVVAVIFYTVGVTARDQAKKAEINAVALLGLSKAEANPIAAIYLALAAWPKSQHSQNPFPPVQVILDSLASTREWHVPIWRQESASHKGASVAFSRNGQRIVSGGSDTTLRIWDVHTGAQIVAPLRRYLGVFVNLDLSPDGRQIASVDQRAVRILSMPNLPGNLFQMACFRISLISTEHILSIERLAEEIGIEGLSLPENCETYDPPLPEGAPG